MLISGEADEYAMRYALDAGVPTIETGHSISENPGLRLAAEHISAHFKLLGSFPRAAGVENLS